eukprot:CAMPEP_0198286232 /NCGR_PEP_ID=MMETSP1449-20131203/5364_1 /TAXON_ID=420275 /ORGANISM="Attheya septentrionalis, Strain CCMP2084" /LENGTH=330 /DNA_ID=CAMNT_0043983911 /DNA_START=40 /DNA_END=1032 /DNA_ORIENTATION=+
MKFSVGVVTLLYLLASLAQSQDEDSFVPVAIVGDLALVNRINLPPSCPQNRIKVLNAMFTIQPSTDGTITVSSFPPNIVQVNQISSSILDIEWLPYNSSSAVVGGGVIISCPPNQMKIVDVGASSIAQIRDGFTSVETIIVSTSAKLTATFTSLNSNSLKLDVSTSGSATVASNQAYDEVSVSTSGIVALNADAKRVVVSTSGRFSMDGNAETGNIGTSGFATIGGDITGDMTVSTSGRLSVGGDITGTIEASTSGSVAASSCDNVSTQTSGRCTQTNVGVVSILVPDLPLTFPIGSTYQCSSSGGFGKTEQLLFVGVGTSFIALVNMFV